jgi:hypothetical protein
MIVTWVRRLHSLLLDKTMENKLSVNWLTVATVQKTSDWNAVVDMGWEVTVATDFSTWLIEPNAWAQLSICMLKVFSDKQTVLNSSNWRYFFHFHICLICGHHNVFSYSDTLSQEMVTSKTMECDNPYVLNVWVTFNLYETYALYIGRAHWYPPNTPFYIFFQQIYVLNFWNMPHTLRFFLFKILFIS